MKEILEVKRENVLKAIASCPDAKNVLGKLFPELNKGGYEPGDRFVKEDEEYILAQVGTFKFCLISLRCGNRYCDPIKVNDTENITLEEMSRMVNEELNEFKRIDK